MAKSYLTTFLIITTVNVLLAAVMFHFVTSLDLAYYKDGILRLDKLKSLEPLEGKCRRLYSNASAAFETDSEDIVKLTDTLFVYTSGDAHTVLEYGHKEAKSGGVFLVDFTEDMENPKIYQIFPENYPIGRPLHPHGMYFSNMTKRLYVINHSGIAKEHSVVELFDVTLEPRVKLTYKGRIVSGFANFVTNDLVEGGENEIYITNWRDTGAPPNGNAPGRMSFFEVLAELRLVFMALGASPNFANTGFYYCRYFPDDINRKAPCIKANKDFEMIQANGITIDREDPKFPNNNILYVNDAVAKTIHVYKVPKQITVPSFEQKNSILNLIEYQRSISLPDAADNIEFDTKRRVIIAGGIPSLFYFVRYVLDHSRIIPGTMMEIDPVTDKVERIFYHDGSLFSSISGCNYVGNNKKAEKAICGSPFSKGVLVCDL